MLKLKLQYSGHLMQRADSLEKTLMLGKIEGRRRGREDETVVWYHQLPEFTQIHVQISSSVVPFFSCPQSLPASESFPMSQLFA